VNSFALKGRITEKTLVPCFFFYGEEPYIAFQFIEELKEILSSPEDQDYNVEKVSLENNSWMDVIDIARTVPFFFSSKRILVVEIPPYRGGHPSSAEKIVLDEYCSSPSPLTVLVIIFRGKLRRDAPLVKFFSSFSSNVAVKELKPLKSRSLHKWMDEKFSSKEHSVSLEAKVRLEELIGNDLTRMNNEIDKILTFLDEKKHVERDDVDQVSGRIRSSKEWEVKDSLEKAEYQECLITFDSLFNEGIKPEYILGLTAKFFRDVHLAKLMLREKEKDRKEIFREFMPQISERYRDLYARRFREFFHLVDSVTMEDLKYFLNELEKIDLKIKTTDASLRTLLEGFLYEYCQIRKKRRAI